MKRLQIKRRVSVITYPARHWIGTNIKKFALWLMTPNKWPLLLIRIANIIDPEIEVTVSVRRRNRYDRYQ